MKHHGRVCMYKLFSVLALFVLSCVCYAQTELHLNTTGQPPLNTPAMTGFMDQVTSEAFRRVGLSLRTSRLPAERGLKNANSGLTDGEMSRIAGLQKIYPNLIRVPESIMDWHFCAFSPQQINLNNSWQSLKPYQVAFINGWKILEKNVPVNSSTIKVKNVDQLFYLLKTSRADLIMYERWGGLLKIKQLKMNRVSLQLPPLATRHMYIYLHRKHKNYIKKIAESLKEMKRDGSYDRISEKILMPLM